MIFSLMVYNAYTARRGCPVLNGNESSVFCVSNQAEQNLATMVEGAIDAIGQPPLSLSIGWDLRLGFKKRYVESNF